MRAFRLSTLRRVVLLLLLPIGAVVVYRWISLERWHRHLIKLAGPETQWAQPIHPTPSPKPTRPPIISGKLETARLFNGLILHSEVETVPGAAASDERLDPQSYVLDLKLRARLPTPNKTIEELARVSPELPKLLPGLTGMLKSDSLSPFFEKLYELKVKNLRANLGRLDQVLSRHNFYDCQTVLQLQAPETKRKVVLLQAEMDVDADGSDADRMPIESGAPANFKPFTSFKWKKKTNAPNPYLPATEAHLARIEAELANTTITPERKRELREARAEVRREIDALKRYSFLIGATDPYIVIPVGFASTGAKIGDYAVVIANSAIYPAIVGDAGPPEKVGEASLRIAREINSLSTPYNRPVSDLKVTYLIFPGTADPKFGPPDLEKMRDRCEKLVNEIGGATVPLHHWQNIIPTPTPTPSPTLTPTASPTSSPSPVVSPSASVSATPSPAPTFAFPVASPSSSPSPGATE